MKKKLVLFFLCFILLFAMACGGGEEADPTPTPTLTPSPSPSPTPTPVNAAKETLDNLETAWESLLTWNGTGNVDATKGFGYDVSMDISVNQLLMSMLGLADIKNIGIDMTMDMNNELLSADIGLSVNEEDLLSMVMASDYEKLVYNLPKYSTEYAGVVPETDPESTVTIPNTEELLSMYKDIVADLFATFKAEEAFIDNATIEREGYKVTGQKFTVTASVSDINKILNEFSSAFLELYPDAEVEVTEIPEDEMSTLVFHVYKGTDGTFAWELYPDTAAEEPMGLISAENGFCLFTTTDGVTEILLSSTKASSTEGTLCFPNDGEEMVLNYTLSDNNITLSDAENTVSVSIGWQFSTDYISLDLSVLTEEIGLVYNMVADGKKSHMELSFSSYDTQLAKLSADYTIRDYKAATMPESFLDVDAWGAQMDSAALEKDLETFLETYPALRTLLGLEEESGDDYTDDDYTDDDWTDYPTYDPSLTYENAFTGMTGYSVDEYGDVYFEPLESEVLALGIPSTGLYYTEITADQQQALIQYVANAFANDIEQSGTFYYVLGNVADDSVESQYFTEFYITDSTNGYNILDLYFEAITGYFHTVDIYSASRDEALRMANDILVILGAEPALTNTLDEASLNEGVWVGDFLIYGYNYGDYYCISIY